MILDRGYNNCAVSRVAQAVWCLPTGWKTERSRFDTRQRRKDSSSSLCVQTGSEAHPTSCTMGTGGPFPGAKTRPGLDADLSPHPVPRSRMSRSYTSSPPSALAVFSGTALAFLITVLRCIEIHIQSRQISGTSTVHTSHKLVTV
jgi:hypothetical protein